MGVERVGMRVFRELMLEVCGSTARGRGGGYSEWQESTLTALGNTSTRSLWDGRWLAMRLENEAEDGCGARWNASRLRICSGEILYASEVCCA